MFVVVLNTKKWSQDWSFAQLCDQRSFYDRPFFISKLNSPKIFFRFKLKLQLFWWWFQGQRLSCNGENSEKFRKSMTSLRDQPVRKPYSRSFGTKVGSIVREHDGVLEPISISWLSHATGWSDHFVIFFSTQQPESFVYQKIVDFNFEIIEVVDWVVFK